MRPRVVMMRPSGYFISPNLALGEIGVWDPWLNRQCSDIYVIEINKLGYARCLKQKRCLNTGNHHSSKTASKTENAGMGKGPIRN